MDEAEEPQYTQSSNISASELDEETKEKLKGDAIGDTLYSQSFVIRTLMRLTPDITYCTEELDQDLCFIWDMTLEKDVCKYLFELGYSSLVSSTITHCKEPRIIEILIGISANMLLSDCEKNMSAMEIKIILDKITTDNSEVLIQIMRFIEAMAWALPDRVHLLEGIIERRFQFILNYSQNFDLITHTMKALIRLTEDFKLDEHEVNELLFKAVVEGFDTIFSVKYNNFEVEIDTEETSRIVKIFLNLITNMCAYVQRFHHDDDIPTSIDHSGRLAISIYKIIRHFSVHKNLFPVTQDFNEYITAFQTIVTTRGVTIVQDLDNSFFRNVFEHLCKILYILHRSKNEVLDSFNIVLEFIGSLICSVDKRAVLTELRNVRYRQRIVVLNSLKESSRTFEFDISEKLRFLFEEFK